MKHNAWKIVGLVITALVVLVLVMVVNAGRMKSQQPDADQPDGLPEVRDGAVDRLSGAVRIPTTSPTEYTDEQLGSFEELHAYLADSFPRTHRTLETRQIGPCSLLYTWQGENPDAKPALLMSHQDVVPVEDDTEWTHPPFSGEVADGSIWGRGTLDIKTGVVAILEATETLLEAKHRPKRTFMFAFGCDEEIGGRRGAKLIAEELEARNTRFAYVLDEGLAITEGIMPGLERPVGLVGLAEKGFLTLELSVTAEGGHSSMPPKTTAIGILSSAIHRLEQNPFPARLNEPARQMFEGVGPEMPFWYRIVFSNLWLLEPILLRQLTAEKQTNAAVRTTTAVTLFDAGVQDNVLPKTARASVNFRIAPGQTIEGVETRVRQIVDDDRVEFTRPEAGFTSNPSPVSSADSAAFDRVRRTTRRVFGEEIVVVPGLTVGGTDSRYFTGISDDVYRFIPMRLGPGDTARIHGVDERIGVDNYRDIVRFYMELMRE